MKPLLVFDFDGTICDSKEISVRILNKVLKSYNHKKGWTEKDFNAYFSRNVFLSLAIILKHRFFLLPKIIGAFTEIAKEELMHAQFFPGQKELFKKLSKQYTCIIITSNSNHVVYNFLRKHKMLEHFKGIYGFEEGYRKSNKLRYAMRYFHAPAKRVVLFTDTAGDIKEGNKVKVHTIGCSWGYQKTESLKKAHPDKIIHNIKEIELVAKKYSN